MRNVLIISDGDDMAGVNHSIKVAFDRFSTKYRLRQVRGSNNYIDYPVDLTWMGNNLLVNELYNAADLVHISEFPWALEGFGGPKIWNIVPKPTVIHQHGEPFRQNPAKFLAICKEKGYTQIVSTVDLLVDDSLVWLPNPVDIDMMQALRREYYVDDGLIRIGHAPTNRSIKGTAEFLDAVKRIGCDYVLIEGQPWQSTLREKARCDIWYDQLTFGYGSNGIEAGAMGIPTVGGFADPAHRQKYLSLVGSLPFIEADGATLGSVLERLVRDSGWRRGANGEGTSVLMRSVHSQSEVVSRLEAIYDQTLKEFEG